MQSIALVASKLQAYHSCLILTVLNFHSFHFCPAYSVAKAITETLIKLLGSHTNIRDHLSFQITKAFDRIIIRS